MSLYINTLLAQEHRAELVRTAEIWRRRRDAKAAAAASRALALRRVEQSHAEPVAIYCRRAAAAGVRGAA